LHFGQSKWISFGSFCIAHPLCSYCPTGRFFTVSVFFAMWIAVR
jgi:hypothetical protein